jgi:hypothetical protein
VSITRANPYLEEIVTILDHHRQKYATDDEARAYLSRSDNEFIDGELLHCMSEPRYFISNYYAIRTEDKGFQGLYPFFDSQEILHDEYRKLEKEFGRVKALVLKARQMGSTTYNCAEFFCKTIFAEHVNAIIVAQDEDQSSYIMGMYESALDFIPWWMRPRIKIRQTGSKINFDEKDDSLRLQRPGLKTWVYADNGRKPTGVGRGKCQVPWTLVWTDSGPSTLRELFDDASDGGKPNIPADGVGEWFVPKRDVFTWAFDGSRLSRKKITGVYRQQYLGPIQKIEASNGVTIEKTPEHGVLSMRQWRNSIDIREHLDRVQDLPWTGTEQVSAEFAELLAWQISEGHDSRYSLCITQKDDEMRSRISSVAEKVIGRAPLNRPTGKRSGYVTFSEGKYRETLSQNGYEWGNRSAKKKIPPCVFRWNKDSVAVFLRTMFEAEGSVSDRVEFVTASRHVSESMRMLCAAFGVSLRMHRCVKYAANTEKKTRRTYYRGNIGGPSLRRFEEQIGFLSDRKRLLLSEAVKREENPNAEVCSYITNMFRSACRESGAPCKKIMGSTKYVKKQNFSRRSALQALDRLESVAKDLPQQFIPNRDGTVTHRFYRQCDQAKLKEWADRIRKELEVPLVEEVVSGVSTYEYDGYIYDLEVEDDHNYPTCGIVTHNTFQRALLSELSQWNNPEQLSKSLFPTFNTPDGFYVMESTANGRNDAWHNLWRDAESGENGWYPIFIPFYRRAKTYSLPIVAGVKFTLTSEEAEMRERVLKTESYHITDETFNWTRKKRREFASTSKEGDDSMFYQEYTSTPEESFQASAVTAFPRAIIHKLSKLTCNPKFVGEISYDFDKNQAKLEMRRVDVDEKLRRPSKGESLHLWERPIKGYEYCVGADVALGNPGGDYSVCQVLKKGQGIYEKDEQVAVWHGLISPGSFAEIVLALARYYNEGLAAVEVNSYGLQTNSILMRSYEYPNLYLYKHLDKMKHFVTDITGFLSTTKTTDALMAQMSESLLEDQIIINDRFTVDEFNDYTEQGAKGAGAHDDRVDALMIALYCAYEAARRERREGINKEKPPENANQFIVTDRNGVIMLQTSSQGEAERFSKRIVGTTINRVAGAKADLQVGERKVKIPSDFQNTEFSPVHDGTGAHRQLYEDGIDAEDITSDMVNEYLEQLEAKEDDPEAWKYQ